MVREAGGVRVDVGGGEMGLGGMGGVGGVGAYGTRAQQDTAKHTEKIPEEESAFGIFSSYKVRDYFTSTF